MVTACTKFEVSPDTYPVVSRFLNEEETKAWGLEPYDTEVADNSCVKAFFSDAMDYLSPRYLNKALQIWRGSSSDGLVTFTGSPGQQRAKMAEVSKFGRAANLRSLSFLVDTLLRPDKRRRK
ncbi:hypothetical protein AB3S75_014660 [Citrus x aurantiifolia]